MTLILTSPPLNMEEITKWSRNLLDTDVTIDGKTKFKVVEIVQFQTIQEGEQIRIIALVRLFGPSREVETNG